MTRNVDPSLIDVVLPEHDGYPPELAGEDTRDVLFGAAGAAAREFPAHMWIEPRDWAAVADENDAAGYWPINFLDRFTNQDPSHECTCHALRTCAEGARNRQRRVQIGPPAEGGGRPVVPPGSCSVWLSPLSIYAEANPRQWGGASTRQVLEIATQRGFLPDRIQPVEYRFAHTLQGTSGKGNACQSGGRWISLGEFPEGWQRTARHFRPLEVVFPESWEQIVCLVLHGLFVGVGRAGHSIPYAEWLDNERLMGYVDSYNIIRYDSLRTLKSAVSGAYAIVSMTTPDDWAMPAGE